MSELSLGRWISLLYRYGQVFITRELEPYHIGRGQYLFLLALYHEDGLSQEELADFIKIDKGTTARALGRLEEAGYVRREQRSEDMRSNRVYLTEKAVEFKPQLMATLNRWTEILSSGMSREEVKTARLLLAKMAQNAVEHIQRKTP